jgi:hypothetical protein
MVACSAVLEALPTLPVVAMFHGVAVLGALGLLAAALVRRRRPAAEPATR